LEGIPIFKYDLGSKEKSAIIIISDIDDTDKILKVMRALNSNPFSIPKDFSQIPSEAYTLAENKGANRKTKIYFKRIIFNHKKNSW
jgi:hypothetical protein